MVFNERNGRQLFTKLFQYNQCLKQWIIIVCRLTETQNFDFGISQKIFEKSLTSSSADWSANL